MGAAVVAQLEVVYLLDEVTEGQEVVWRTEDELEQIGIVRWQREPVEIAARWTFSNH
jgi:hypothetical protein